MISRKLFFFKIFIFFLPKEIGTSLLHVMFLCQNLIVLLLLICIDESTSGENNEFIYIELLAMMYCSFMMTKLGSLGIQQNPPGPDNLGQR